MKVRFLDLTRNPVNKEHQDLGIPPVEESVTHTLSLDQPARDGVVGATSEDRTMRLAMWFAVLTIGALIIYLFARLFITQTWTGGINAIGETLTDNLFWIAVAVGFFAQAVDGALGMAYGITATTFLLSSGASPAVASASVHIAEIFTTGFSGIAHARFGNVNKKLFLRLLVPGMIGGIVGAIVVTQIDGKILRPYVSAYLVIMGAYILAKAWRYIRPPKNAPRHVGKLALFGGFVDAAGGGGWGPVVTTTLLGRGEDPRTTIGSVNFAEFFLALASAALFAILVGAGTWPIVGGLVVGGLFAAPFAALLCKKLHAKTLMIVVGLLITGLSLWNLYKAFA
ncbi:MAG TPA: sulfite exporter TauE/SafE family protein [Burkholderiales bacterium]|nr:sulfite exporter TauE/SafE family protein [Burkholderiales bacterium]